jgi:hypothetical protein
MLNFIPAQINSFLPEIIFPTSISELSKKNKIIAVIAAAIFATFTLCLIYMKGSCFPSRSVKPIEDQPSEETTSKKISDLGRAQNLDSPQEENEANDVAEIKNEPALDSFQSNRNKFSDWLSHAAKDRPKQYKDGSVDLVMQSLDSSKSKEEFFKSIDDLEDHGHIAGKSAQYIKRKYENLFRTKRHAKKITNQQDFQACRDKFVRWLNQSAQDFPGQYQGNVDLVIKCFDSSNNETEFNKGIDKIKNEKGIRGQAAFHIKEKFKELIATDAPLPSSQDSILDIAKLGMKVKESHPAFPEIETESRRDVQNNTIIEVSEQFRIKPPENFHQEIESVVQQINNPEELPASWLKDYFRRVILFTPEKKPDKHKTSDTRLLGRFDVLAVPCTMDYDANWKKQDHKVQKEFYIHNGLAIHLGGKNTLEDWENYKMKNGSFDKEAYLEDMGKIFHQMLAAQEAAGSEHAVWFPFGMGATLRKLPDLDSAYKDRQVFNDLKQEIAEAFVEEVCKFPNLQIHMCLPLDDQHDSDVQQNYNAMVNAFSKAPEKFKNRVSFYINVDATDLAQRLANLYKDNYKVSLANATNRDTIGNQWSNMNGPQSMDDHLYQRSVLSASIAVVLNNGIKIKATPRKDNDLSDRVKQFEGQHLNL